MDERMNEWMNGKKYFSQHNRLPPEQKPKLQTTDHRMIPVRDARLWPGAGGGTAVYSWAWLFYYCTQAVNIKHF
jgi:hypothetical protein